MQRRSMTEQVKKALAAACRLARDHSQAFVGTEALLYAVLETAPLSTFFTFLASREALRRDLAAALEAAPKSEFCQGLQLSPRAREALEAAAQEAEALGAEETGLGHILLGFLSAERKGFAGLVLEQHGLAADDLRLCLQGRRQKRRPRESTRHLRRLCPSCGLAAPAWRVALGPKTFCQECFRVDLRSGQARLGRQKEKGSRVLGLYGPN